VNPGSASLRPARLEPIFSPRPWGARTLAPLFPEKSNLAEPLGEAWMTGVDCRFASGPFAGQKLGDVWRTLPPLWTGTRIYSPDGSFPLLVKFIFADEKLSVQVHPDDDYAGRHEKAAGGRGKTEMWYAIHARPGAEVLAGLKPGVTQEIFKRAIEDGSAENCLQHVPLHAGEAIFVPAGTAHTIGAGLVLCEIQEYSDLTYRVFDYNRRDAQGRSRELHIEKALQVIRFGEHHGGKIAPVRVERVEEHQLHREPFTITPEAASKINGALAASRRVIAVGTTTVRALEYAADYLAQTGGISAGSGEADIFIYPGYKFKVVAGLLTNFHLPQSTLLMLVCAFAGRENVLHAYHHAVAQRYRFYSYGDCMFLA